MVLSAAVVAAVADVSANLCQYIACNPERFSSDQVLRLLFCFPFQHVRHFALSLTACLCFVLSSDTSSSSSDSDSDLSAYSNDSHSD
ncbi:hypothetical protein CDL15_Pgr002987 [Punica granatum]|uniref:Uncharacterized protein n=1 Tax=Punica granatum TaxID=22663 RepID=A0A218X288_PUNGR|nr:hypothetical protein CDL15_Pgr002987 [Punica granatum]PKI34071.1 hypothetical protein CRG98_045528 [Punica granatum]